MPNWCNNYFVLQPCSKIEAEKLPHEKSKDYDKAVKLILKDDELEQIKGFEIFYPRPKEKDKEWYDWNCSNWGTKWNINSWGICAHDIGEDNRLCCSFDTAWSPPISFAKKLSELYPDMYVGLDYEEPGCDFGGFTLWLNGEEIEGKGWSIAALAKVHNCIVEDEEGYEEIDWEYFNEIDKPSCEDYMN
tara:strand:+ start:156 stop:722 length:567 start_codon:yes stop_codon:yes gene_type:complete